MLCLQHADVIAGTYPVTLTVTNLLNQVQSSFRIATVMLAHGIVQLFTSKATKRLKMAVFMKRNGGHKLSLQRITHLHGRFGSG
ncbi:hypothetical protein BGP78_02220 [Pseudoalteromonas sp. MSK9-3]|nr:hypothetical protein BGP78_02220 [Pseudoalteromonas sp. MSK9-3]